MDLKIVQRVNMAETVSLEHLKCSTIWVILWRIVRGSYQRILGVVESNKGIKKRTTSIFEAF